MLLAPQNLSQLTLNPPASFPELYQELWWYSGSAANPPTQTTAGSTLITKGALSGNTYSNSQNHLFTLSSSWSSTQKVAFEAAIYTANASQTMYAELWDCTSNTAVSGSQISTTSTTMTVVRSGQFTLTAGHTYGVTMWASGTSYNTYLTDASLIIFPPAGSVSPSLSSISLANPSGGTLKEAYIPLWVYSSSTANSNTATATQAFIQKGTTGISASLGTSQEKLHTLNASWSASQKFALEVSIFAQSSTTAYTALYDFTSSTLVASSQVSTTSTTATVIRSGQFTLTPGHSYGLCLWTATSGISAYLTKAHLVALGG